MSGGSGWGAELGLDGGQPLDGRAPLGGQGAVTLTLLRPLLSRPWRSGTDACCSLFQVWNRRLVLKCGFYSADQRMGPEHVQRFGRGFVRFHTRPRSFLAPSGQAGPAPPQPRPGELHVTGSGAPVRPRAAAVPAEPDVPAPAGLRGHVVSKLCSSCTSLICSRTIPSTPGRGRSLWSCAGADLTGAGSLLPELTQFHRPKL